MDNQRILKKIFRHFNDFILIFNKYLQNTIIEYMLFNACV